MRLWQPLAELRERLRGYPPVVLVLAAPLYLVVFFGCLITLPLLLPLWLLGPILRPLVAPIARSRAVRWMSTKRVEDFFLDAMALVHLFDWDVTQAGDLLERIRSFRRVLLVFIVGQWALLVAVGLLTGLSLLWSLADLAYLGAIPCAACVILGSILSMIGLSYYNRLYRCWREFGMPTCGQCGYIRKDGQAARCPECGSAEPAVGRGCLPTSHDLWRPLINGMAASGAFFVLCAAFYFDRAIMKESLSPTLHGWAVLVITASVAGLVLWVLWFFWFRWRRVYLRGRVSVDRAGPRG